jgi:hypothetical protein
VENLLLSSLTYYSVFSSGLDDLKSLTQKEKNSTVLSMVQNLTILRVSLFCVEHLLCVCGGGGGGGRGHALGQGRACWRVGVSWLSHSVMSDSLEPHGL